MAFSKFLSLLAVLMAGPLFTSAGQEPNVTVTGIVVDWQYARVIETTIVFKSAGDMREVKVDQVGAYKVDLPPGRYLITARAPGFRDRRVKLQLEPTTSRVLNLMLDVQPQNFHCPKNAICLQVEQIDF